MHNILCFSHDWGGDPLSKNHLMRLAARRHRVLWVNSIGYRAPTASASDAKRVVQKLRGLSKNRLKRVEPNIWTLNPLVVPAYGSATLRRLSRALLARQVRGALRRLGMKRPVNWVFNPAAAMVSGCFDESLLVYYCVDDYLEIEGVNRTGMARLEDSLLERADLVIASTDVLCESKARNGRRPELIKHGVQYDHFRRAVNSEGPIPEDVGSLPGPVIGYFGLMSRDWFDTKLVRRVAEAYPHGSLVLLGKSTMDLSELQDLPNVHVLGQKPFEQLPDYCRAFDAAILPFPVTPLTLAANPLKVREYLAAGLPVVSTRIPEVEAIGGCLIADDEDGFVRAVGDALEDSESRETRSRSMQAESWELKYDRAESLILGKLAEREAIS